MKKVLDFLCLLSDDGERLSLTNLALISLTVKMLAAPNLDWPATITMMTVFANYAHKRHGRNAVELKEQTTSIRDLEQKLSPLIDKVKGML